jgi:hypothetical protein
VKYNIEDYIFHKENFMGNKYCDHSIEILNKANWRQHEFDYSGESFEEDEARNKGEFTVLTGSDLIPSRENNPSEMLDYDAGFDIEVSRELERIDTLIIENLKDALLEYLSTFQFGWFRGWQGYSGIKFNRYLPGQEMRVHWDNIHSMFDGERKGVPILSVIGIMNDDYEGGDLMICKNKIDTKKGDLLIFPSSFMYPHQVMPVTKGVRHSYVSWVW